jgi:hypothetical protein
LLGAPDEAQVISADNGNIEDLEVRAEEDVAEGRTDLPASR